MRLLGYPADKIAILTTYNGQRALIGDVLQQVSSVSHFTAFSGSRVVSSGKLNTALNTTQYLLLQ
jgi:hypothetical protein